MKVDFYTLKNLKYKPISLMHFIGLSLKLYSLLGYFVGEVEEESNCIWLLSSLFCMVSSGERIGE